MTWRWVSLAILVPALWGGNFVAAKLALAELPTFLLLALRFFFVALLMLPFVKRPAVTLRQVWILSLLLGVFHFALMFGGIAMGLDATGAVVASQLGVPFSCMLGSILLKDRLGPRRIAGLLLSFAGIVIVADTPRVQDQIVAFIVCCLGSLSWGASNIYMKRLGDVPVMSLLAWMSLLCVPQFLLLSLLFESGQLHAVQAAGMHAWVSLTYTVICSTIIAYGAWYYLLQAFPMNDVMPYSLLVPVFGLAASHAFFHEPLTPAFMIGALLTIAGVAVILLRRTTVVVAPETS